MYNVSKLTSAAVGVLLATSVSASAALIDFTDNTVGFVGSVGGGTTYTLTGVPQAPNTNYAGGACSFGNCNPLKLDNDGVGIEDDEVTTFANGNEQYLILTFSEKVRLTAAYYLDLYFDPVSQSIETANITVGNMPGAIDAMTAAVSAAGNGPGFAKNETLSLVGTQFTFFVGLGNDGQGRADSALGGVRVSAVPLPAGLLLLGTALGGFGMMRRRKKA